MPDPAGRQVDRSDDIPRGNPRLRCRRPCAGSRLCRRRPRRDAAARPASARRALPRRLARRAARRVAAQIADAGAVVVSVEYALANARPFPAALEFVFDVLAALKRRCAKLATRKSFLFVAGEEAGGNLAAGVALMARDQGEKALRGQILLSPMLDPFMATGSFRKAGAARSQCKWADGWNRYLGFGAKACHPYAAPAHCVRLAGVAPALVITAEDDPTRDESLAYAQRLRAAGVLVRERVLAGRTDWPDSLCRPLRTASGIGRENCAANSPLSSSRPERCPTEGTTPFIGPKGRKEIKMTVFNSRRLLAGAALARPRRRRRSNGRLRRSHRREGRSRAPRPRRRAPFRFRSRPSRPRTSRHGRNSPAASKRSTGSSCARASPAPSSRSNFREGALVKKGDVLVTIDPGALSGGGRQGERARFRAGRGPGRSGRGWSSTAPKSVVPAAPSRRAISTSAPAPMTQAVATLPCGEGRAAIGAELDLGYTEVRAPIAGRIGKIQVTAGNLVAAGRVVAGADDASSRSIRSMPASTSTSGRRPHPGRTASTGATVRVPSGTNSRSRSQSDGGKAPRSAGSLQFIDNHVDTGERHAACARRVRQPRRPPAARPVRPRRASASRSRRPQVLISERAVGTDQDKKFVLVVGGDTDRSPIARSNSATGPTA